MLQLLKVATLIVQVLVWGFVSFILLLFVSVAVSVWGARPNQRAGTRSPETASKEM